MRVRNPYPGVRTVSLRALWLLALLCLAGGAPAAVLEFDREIDGGTQGTLVWNTTLATNWYDATIPGDPAAVPGASDDAVIDTRSTFQYMTGGNRTVTIAMDVGTVNSLKIGGGTHTTSLSLNNSASRLTVTGNVTIGGVDQRDGTTQRAGNLTVGNNNASIMTINGNIVSGSTADSDITINANGGALNLAGNIDAAGTHEIDLTIQRGTINLTGGTQALHVEEFNLVDIGGASVTNSWTLGTGKSLVASARADIGRNDSGSGQTTARTVRATLDLLGGSATFAELVLGNIAASPDKTNQVAEGYINVGDAGTAGRLTVNGELRLAPTQNVGAKTATSVGQVVVNHADSVVTIHAGIEMAANANNPLATATITVNDGLLRLRGANAGGFDIEDGAGSSTINLNGGRFSLESPNAGGFRTLDTFNFNGGTLNVVPFGGMPALATTDTALAAAAGGSVIDVTLPAADWFASTTDKATWVGGTGTWDATAVGKWDADPSNGAYVLPSGVASVVKTGDVLTVLTSTNAIVGQGNAALAGTVTGWTLDQTGANSLALARTGDAFGAGPGVAVIDAPTSIITRDVRLNIQAAGGQGADASQLEISDGSLALSGSNDLVLGGSGGEGLVNQAGGAVTVGGTLRYGMGNATDMGGAYNLFGGTLTVDGVDGGGYSIVETDAAVGSAQLHIDGGTLNVAGDILVQSFRVGNAEGAAGSYTLADGKTITNTGTVIVGELGSGELTVGGGGAGATVTSGSNLYVAHATPTAGAAAGSLTINQGSAVHVTGEMRMGGGTDSTSSLVLDGGTLTTTGTFIAADWNGAHSTVNINRGTFSVGGNAYWGDDQYGSTGTGRVNVGVGGGAPDVRVGGALNIGWWSPGIVTMDSGTLEVTGGNLDIAGRGAPGTSFTMNGGALTVGSGVTNRATVVGDFDGSSSLLEIKAGSANFYGEIRTGDDVGAAGTVRVGQGGGNPTVVVKGGNTEMPQNGIGTFELYGGTWYQDDNNFVQSQGASATSRVHIHGGTLDLTGQSGANTGQWNINAGSDNETYITGGVVRIGGAIQLTDGAAEAAVFNIGDDLGADPVVLVGINLAGGNGISYRNNGTDTINFKSGLLDLHNLAIDADTTGTNEFNWTGGTLARVAEFQGSLTQGNSTAASLLRIGSSPGAMSVLGDYALAAPAAYTGTLELELFAMGATAGADYDYLDITGTADLFGTVQVLDVSGGAIDTKAAFTWDVVKAETINLTGTTFDLPEDYFYKLIVDGDGSRDILRIYTVPEPAGLLVLSLGGVAALWRRRRR